MGTDHRRLVTAAALAIACASSPAVASAADLSRWFGIFDSRFPQRTAVLYTLPDSPAKVAQELGFLQLTPEPGPNRARCCVRVRAGIPTVDPDTEALWLGPGEETTPLAPQTVQRSRQASSRGIALALRDPKASVEQLDAQTIRIHWPDRGPALRVMRCVSHEGLHILVTPEGSQPGMTRHLYVSLGMEVEPTCPAAIMAPAAPR